jgi:hypothetical protein
MPTYRQSNSQHPAVIFIRNVALAAVLSICAFCLGNLGVPVLQAQEQEVPVVRADIGPCSADFTVTDSESKPLYDAKIHVQVRYGFLSKRKTDLEVGTNSDGKARFEGLPEKAKKPWVFHIRHEKLSKSVAQDPASECHASFTVALGAG